jgi:hypothetical protein
MNNSSNDTSNETSDDVLKQSIQNEIQQNIYHYGKDTLFYYSSIDSNIAKAILQYVDTYKQHENESIILLCATKFFRYFCQSM